jgi:hypothetical protein
MIEDRNYMQYAIKHMHRFLIAVVCILASGVERTALADHDYYSTPQGPIVCVTTPDGAQWWYGGQPTTGYATRVWLDAKGNPQLSGPPASLAPSVGWPWRVK